MSGCIEFCTMMGDSEELTRYELVKHIEGVDRSDSGSECNESESDSDYKEYFLIINF